MVFLHRGKLGQQNSLYQDTTCLMYDSKFSETISVKFKIKITLNCACSSGHTQCLHQKVFCSHILKSSVNIIEADVQHGHSPCYI